MLKQPELLLLWLVDCDDVGLVYEEDGLEVDADNVTLV